LACLKARPTIQEVEIWCKAGGQNPEEITAKFNQVKSVVNANLVQLEKIKAEKEANLSERKLKQKQKTIKKKKAAKMVAFFF
jgi:hypothetical protein